MAHIDLRTVVDRCADRPFTDSEVRFLKYIRQWGKKVVFLLNKVDILSDSAEVSAIGSGGVGCAGGLHATLPLTCMRRQAVQLSLAECTAACAAANQNPSPDSVKRDEHVCAG